MTARLPREAAAYSAWLRDLPQAELDAVISEQLADEPDLVLALAEALALPEKTSWRAQLTLGSSVDNEASFVEVPLDEESFLALVLGHSGSPPARLRLNVRPQQDGSELEVDVLLPAVPRPGLTIRCVYELDGHDVMLQPGERGEHLVGRSWTQQSLSSDDAIHVRLVVVEADGDTSA